MKVLTSFSFISLRGITIQPLGSEISTTCTENTLNRWVRRYPQPVRRIHKTVGFGDIHNLYGEYIKPFGFKDIPYSTTIADSRVTKLTYSQNKIKILLNVLSFRVSPLTSISCRSLKFVPTLTDILVGV